MSGVSGGQKIAAAAIGIPTALLVYLRLKYPSIRDDIASIRRSLRQLNIMNEALDKNYTVLDNFEEHARDTPNKPFIFFKHECHTYGHVDREANKMAHFAQDSGKLKFGDTVALLLPNAPSFIWNFLAFNKLGVGTAFLNFNLKPQALLHCITISEAKIVICNKGK